MLNQPDAASGCVDTTQTPNRLMVCVANTPLAVTVNNFPAALTAVIARTDAQAQARLGNLSYVTSDLVTMVIGTDVNILTVTNPTGSGKVVSLASIAVQSATIVAVRRLRNASVTSATGNTLTTLTGLLAGITGGTIRTAGVASGGTLESTTMSGQSDPSVSGTVRIDPGQSLTWSCKIAVAGSVAVSLQVWQEPAS